MLYSLRILALKKEEERNSKSINHMGQWHTALRLHELNFSVVGIIYRIGPQEYPLLVLQSDYLEQSFRKKIAKSEVLCHSRCGMKEIPCDNFVSQELLDQYLFHMCAKCAIFYSNLIYHGTVDMSKKAAFCNDD